MTKRNILDEFERYRKMEEITFSHTLNEAKNHEEEFNKLKDLFKERSKIILFTSLYFVTFLVILFFYLSFHNTNQESLVYVFNEISNNSELFGFFMFIHLLALLLGFVYSVVYLFTYINYLFKRKRDKKEKDFVLKYNDAKREVNNIIEYFNTKGKDEIIILYKELIKKNNGVFDSDYENYEGTHEEFSSFYDLSSHFFNLKKDEFNREELEDAFILYSAKKNNYSFNKVEINNL